MFFNAVRLLIPQLMSFPSGPNKDRTPVSYLYHKAEKALILPGGLVGPEFCPIMWILATDPTRKLKNKVEMGPQRRLGEGRSRAPGENLK